MSENTSTEPQKIANDDDGTPAVEPDVQSDPAKDVSEDSDWSTEGGATPSGPAMETGARDQQDEPKH
ncbi:hypothetical protein [Arthrobacter roseus]|uniref:hypothetical protein n=1 Tax=Arthrobacter roseus TaxID=136274 RepID=UPI0019634DC3|nr:hypothetical protein [Arthrobacter roseus]MBM7849498.1 hypothetical protein [Arthrobacter roseus]